MASAQKAQGLCRLVIESLIQSGYRRRHERNPRRHRGSAPTVYRIHRRSDVSRAGWSRTHCCCSRDALHPQGRQFLCPRSVELSSAGIRLPHVQRDTGYPSPPNRLRLGRLVSRSRSRGRQYDQVRRGHNWDCQGLGQSNRKPRGQGTGR